MIMMDKKNSAREDDEFQRLLLASAEKPLKSETSSTISRSRALFFALLTVAAGFLLGFQGIQWFSGGEIEEQGTQRHFRNDIEMAKKKHKRRGKKHKTTTGAPDTSALCASLFMLNQCPYNDLEICDGTLNQIVPGFLTNPACAVPYGSSGKLLMLSHPETFSSCVGNIVLPNVGHICGPLVYADNNAVLSFDFPALETTGDYFLLSVITSSSFDFQAPNLRFVDGDFEIVSTSAAALSLPKLEKTTGWVDIYGNPQLTTISLPELREPVRDLFLQDNPELLTVSVPKLYTTQGLIIRNNAKLESLSFPEFVFTTEENPGDSSGLLYGQVMFTENPVLVNVSLPKLETITGWFDIDQNLELEMVDAPLLNEIGGFLYVWGNPKLLSISLPELTKVTDLLSYLFDAGYIFISNNAALEVISLPKLQSIDNYFDLGGNPSVATLDVSALETIGTSHSIENLHELTDLAYPELRATGVNPDYTAGYFDVTNCNKLVTLAAPKLEIVDGYFQTFGFPLLTDLTFPSLKSARNIYVTTMPELETLSMPAIETLTHPFTSGKVLEIVGNAANKANTINNCNIGISGSTNGTCDVQANCVAPIGAGICGGALG